MSRPPAPLPRPPALRALSLISALTLVLAGLAFLTGFAAPDAPGPLRITVGVAFLLLAVYRVVLATTSRDR